MRRSLHIIYISMYLLHAINIRMAEAVMFEGDVFQQPRIPAVKETNMKKNPTMNRAIMARIISTKKNVIENIYQNFLQKILINCIIKSQRGFSKSSTHVFLSSFLVQTLLFHYPCQGYSNQCFYSRSPPVRHRAPPVLVLACHFH